MYEAFYGFTQPPFGLSPDVHFCYRHRSYNRAKAYMQYAVTRGEGFLVVTGRPGMGKTTLIQDLLGDLGSRRRLVARIDSTQLDADDLLRLVTYAFGLPAKGVDKATLVHGLGEFLSGRPESAGTAILVVDEAQNLSSRSLEELRLITNLQRGARALIQIFLVGQESLRDIIRHRSLEQLQQRIVAACHLDPLDLVETRAYIRHRLLCAGWSGDPVYEAEALRLIYEASGGIPRLINKVCDRLLLHGSVEEIHRLTGGDARLVIGEFHDEFMEHTDGEPLGSPAKGSTSAALSEIEDLRADPETPAPLPGLFASDRRSSPDQAASMPGMSSESTDADATRATGAVSVAPPAGSTPLPFAQENQLKGDKTEDPWGLFEVADNDQPRSESIPDPFAAHHSREEPIGAASASALGTSGPKMRPEASLSYGTVRKQHLGFWPYAAAAALLLGVGGLVFMLQGKNLDELGAQIGQLADTVTDELRSLSGQTIADSGPAVPGPGGDAPTRPAPEPRAPAAGEESSAGIVPDPSVRDDTLAPEAGFAETATSDSALLPIHPVPNEPAARGRPESETIAHTGPIGVPALEVGAGGSPALAESGDDDPTSTQEPTTRDQATLSLAEPAPRAADQWERSTPDRVGTDAPGNAVPLAESETPRPTPSELGLPEARVGGGSIPSLEVDLHSIGLQARGLGDGRLTLDLGEEVPFARGSARLPDQAERVLAPLAKALVRNPDVRITLIGHTDDSGSAEYNRRLSLSRAHAVAAYLVRQGVAEQRLSSQGMGKDAPLPKDQGVTAARQRRVEVVIEPTPR